MNCALMAPTEILAEQHWHTFRRWLEPLGAAVELRTGSLKTGEKTGSLRPTLFIGTHALVEAAFVPDKLGLVIIDEQHKFGVSQREQLLRKGAYPHLLVMTATPIPRTLGLTLYGDLDISIIDQSPEGRGQLKTYVRKPNSLPKVWEFIRSTLKEGRQAYIVYSRVEDTGDAGGLKAVRAEYERLRGVFAPFETGLLHGQLNSAEKERVMAAFRANAIQILVATTVVEVGLDVPNATIMLIENAEFFGLAQLHQLRGRIGRGAHDSYCILVAEAKTEDAKARLKIMRETCDGFRIAEEDLRLRGPGEFLGKQQSGAAPLIFGNLAADGLLVERARALAKESLSRRPARAT
jgi:ATP-dependent DNA helicase RecG